MTKQAFAKILDQLYQAQSQGLIHNYTHNYLSPVISHQKHYHPIPNPKTTIFIAFTTTTPQSKTKVALQGYFLNTHKSLSHLLEHASILRVDL